MPVAQNLVRGRGLFCRSIMKSQMASPTYTPVFAALVAVVNTKFPEIGELLLHRLVLQACPWPQRVESRALVLGIVCTQYAQSIYLAARLLAVLQA